MLLLRSAGDPDAALVRASQAATQLGMESLKSARAAVAEAIESNMSRRATGVGGRRRRRLELSELDVLLDEEQRLPARVDEMVAVAKFWVETGVPPYGYGESSDEVREDAARRLVDAIDGRMMEIFEAPGDGSSAILEADADEYADLLARGEAALMYTRSERLTEQIESLLDVILEMRETLDVAEEALLEKQNVEEEVVVEEEEVEEEEEEAPQSLDRAERAKLAAEAVEAADRYFERGEIDEAISRAQEASELASVGSKTWEEAMLILGQGYQRVQNDAASSEVFQQILKNSTNKKTRVMAAQLQAIAEAPELSMKSDASTSISMLPAEAYMGSDPPRYKKPEGSKPSPAEVVMSSQSKQADEFFKVCAFQLMKSMQVRLKIQLFSPSPCVRSNNVHNFFLSVCVCVSFIWRECTYGSNRVASNFSRQIGGGCWYFSSNVSHTDHLFTPLCLPMRFHLPHGARVSVCVASDRINFSWYARLCSSSRLRGGQRRYDDLFDDDVCVVYVCVYGSLVSLVESTCVDLQSYHRVAFMASSKSTSEASTHALPLAITHTLSLTHHTETSVGLSLSSNIHFLSVFFSSGLWSRR